MTTEKTTSHIWSYSVTLEMIGIDYVNGNPLDSDQDIPFAVVYETHDDLLRLCPGSDA